MSRALVFGGLFLMMLAWWAGDTGNRLDLYYALPYPLSDGLDWLLQRRRLMLVGGAMSQARLLAPLKRIIRFWAPI